VILQKFNFFSRQPNRTVERFTKKKTSYEGRKEEREREREKPEDLIGSLR
jgi:hypothetical protein